MNQSYVQQKLGQNRVQCVGKVTESLSLGILQFLWVWSYFLHKKLS